MISKCIDKLREGESLQADEAEHCSAFNPGK